MTNFAMTKSVLQEVWLFLFSLSLLHTTLSQCTPFDDPTATCSVSECLQCSSVPANCTHDDDDNTRCEADTSECETVPCGEGQQVCSVDYINNDAVDWTASFNCFPFLGPSVCSEDSECRFSTITGQGLATIECCCFEDNCFNGSTIEVMGRVASSSTDTSGTTTTTTTTAPPITNTTAPPITNTTAPPITTSSSSISTIVVAGLVLLVVVVVVVVVVMLLVCYRHSIQKHCCFSCYYCCCCCWRPKTTQTSISRQFSVRSSQPWVLQGLVGQGKFGHVYKALYRGEVVAVKVYSHHNRTTWENERNLFSLESTRHLNIIDFVTSDTNECRGVVNSPLQLYLVTQYYPLGTLQEFLRTHVLSWQQACLVVRDVACGLKHLHSDMCGNGDGICMEKYPIAHRDIKTSNILMKSEQGGCAIADLGLALQLVPTDDPSEISNHGQAGTLRYMSPEALEARVNLMDLQSFKQIDVYAFALVMWEVISRCCVLTPEDVGEYELPFADMVTRPTLEVMKDVVCTRQLRPLIPTLWSNHEPLATFAELVRECWDEDPTARLTAGNIHYQMDDLCNSAPPQQQIQQGHHHHHAPSNSQQGHAPTTNQPHTLPDVVPVLFQEHSQSSPPPCYSPTDPIPFSIAQNHENRSRGFFQSSMPHMVAIGDQWEAESAALTPRCTRSLRSSAAYPQQGQSGWSQYHPPLSVRNSLVLGGGGGGGHMHGHDDPLPTFSDATLSSSHSVTGMGMGRIGAACSSNLSSVLELNMDSGIQINTSQSSQNSSLSPPSDATPTFIESTL